MKAEKSEKKIFNYTIQWKNIEWTFDCSPGDLKGHAGKKHDNFPVALPRACGVLFSAQFNEVGAQAWSCKRGRSPSFFSSYEAKARSTQERARIKKA